jgi:hypothetical protein
MSDDDPRDLSDPRQAAISRLNAKRTFWTSLIGYAFVSAVLIVIWALTGMGGSFWPIWFIAFAGLGEVMHAWRVFGQRPITEDEIQREMRRGG